MKEMRTFATINEKVLSEIIASTRCRFVFAAPGIALAVAESVVRLKQEIENVCIEVVLDADAEVCRLGYGVFAALERLTEAGVMIRKAEGLRIGVVISDNKAWVYSPTPLVIEDATK